MAIPWGASVLSQANDAASDAANDFNQNLHEHFKVARRAGMKLDFENSDPTQGGSGPTGRSVELLHPDTFATTTINHNRKTGGVTQTPYESRGYENFGSHSSPKEAGKAINKAKKASMENDAAIDADDANPITPFHDVIRAHGGSYAGHTREGKHGEVRKNIYKIPNPNGGHETVEAHAHQGGPDYGTVNTITHSGDPEGTVARVNNSPDKLDRNIHAQSYRAPKELPAKMKPAEIRENHKRLTSDSDDMED